MRRLLWMLALCQTSTDPVWGQVEARTPLALGETAVWLVTCTHDPSGEGPVLLNLHDDENTAVEAARAYLAGHPGRLLELRHTGTRLITFALDGQSYTFDPNRMFTDAGATASLQRHGTFTPAALDAVRQFAQALLAQVQPTTYPLLVALHNNTDEGWSARSYADDGEAATEAAAVHLAPGQDSDDFFFVTEASLFERLAGQGFNVVLQDNAQATDDGSLSVWCAQQGVPYANVEAEHGHAGQQVTLLKALLQK
jgi:hypothetical protein